MRTQWKRLKRLFATGLAAAFALMLLPISAKAASGAWDGKTIDVSWYNSTDTAFNISTPAQLMGLAAIVNGLYNTDITTVIGDASCIKANSSSSSEGGGNNRSTSAYHYGTDNFSGKTIRLTADLDMGGIYDAASGTWSGPNYMPIGGQYLMTPDDSSTKLSASFCGTLDGQGHTVYHIFCSRRCTTGNFGDGESVGLIGRLGVHDNDPTNIRPLNPTVENVAVTGYVDANRSVGGIVGKIGKTSYNNGDKSTGGIIANCANFATVSNTDSKGCGGIVGAGWNGGIVKNCYNAGCVMSSYSCPTGGVSGSNEIVLNSCYSTGSISAAKASFAMAIGTNNGGAPYKSAVLNCWYLAGSAPGGGYFSGAIVNSGELTADKLKSPDFVKTLGSAFIADTNGINGGYPILNWQKDVKVPYLSAYSDVSVTSWYFSAVNAVLSKGLFDKAGTGQFGPEEPMTRAMLAEALYRLSGSPAASGEKIFTDVPDNTPFVSAVNWAYKNGIVTGSGAGLFDPSGSITREQIAAMLFRYTKQTGTDTSASGDLSAFSDAGTVSPWALDAVSWAVGRHLISGMGDGSVAPQGTATRAQVAAVIARFAGL